MFGLLPEAEKEEFDVFYDMISQMFGLKSGVLTLDDVDDKHIEELEKLLRQSDEKQVGSFEE